MAKCAGLWSASVNFKASESLVCPPLYYMKGVFNEEVISRRSHGHKCQEAEVKTV